MLSPLFDQKCILAWFLPNLAQTLLSLLMESLQYKNTSKELFQMQIQLFILFWNWRKMSYTYSETEITNVGKTFDSFTNYCSWAIWWPIFASCANGLISVCFKCCQFFTFCPQWTQILRPLHIYTVEQIRKELNRGNKEVSIAL